MGSIKYGYALKVVYSAKSISTVGATFYSVVRKGYVTCGEMSERRRCGTILLGDSLIQM